MLSKALPMSNIHKLNWIGIYHSPYETFNFCTNTFFIDRWNYVQSIITI